MSEEAIQILGTCCAIITTGGFVPQAWKTFKTKSAKDFSPLMLIALTIGCSGWALYGVLRSDYPVFLANVVTLLMVFVIDYYKIKEKKQKNKTK